MFRTTTRELLDTIGDLRKDVHDAHVELARVQTQLAERTAQLAVAQTNFEWARLRMNQLEHERSQLFAHVLKIPLAPMVVDREPAPPAGIPFGLGADMSFEDIGDDAARALGLDEAAAR